MLRVAAVGGDDGVRRIRRRLVGDAADRETKGDGNVDTGGNHHSVVLEGDGAGVERRARREEAEHVGHVGNRESDRRRVVE